MIEIIIGCAVAALTGPAGFIAGAKRMKTVHDNNKANTFEAHTHYWSPWTDTEIDDEDFRGNKVFMRVFAVKVPAQQRRCNKCNEVEVVRVKSMTTKDFNYKYDYEGWMG